MLAQEIIRTKRDGRGADAAQIEAFVKGLTDGSRSEGQVAALGMAVFLRGMGRDEAAADLRHDAFGPRDDLARHARPPCSTSTPAAVWATRSA